MRGSCPPSWLESGVKDWGEETASWGGKRCWHLRGAEVIRHSRGERGLEDRAQGRSRPVRPAAKGTNCPPASPSPTPRRSLVPQTQLTELSAGQGRPRSPTLGLGPRGEEPALGGFFPGRAGTEMGRRESIRRQEPPAVRPGCDEGPTSNPPEVSHNDMLLRAHCLCGLWGAPQQCQHPWFHLTPNSKSKSKKESPTPTLGPPSSDSQWTGFHVLSPKDRDNPSSPSGPSGRSDLHNHWAHFTHSPPLLSGRIPPPVSQGSETPGTLILAE